MRILAQWSLADPADWVALDAADWSRLPAGPEPAGLGGINNTPGYICGLNVQGVSFDGDHYAVESLPGGACRVSCWNDDAEDYPAGRRSARVWTFEPLAPDPLFGGAINTRQSKLIYLEPGIRADYDWAGWNKAELRPWSEFTPPPVELHRHGIWLPDQLYEKHYNRRSLHGWREWTEGVDPALIRDGRVIDQRAAGRYAKSKFTKTYYHRDDNATAIGAVAAEYENLLSTTTAAVGSQTSANLSGGGSSLVWAAATPSGEPNDAAWPTPMSSYRCQIDCTAQGGDITYGCTLAGAATGAFYRLNSTLTTSLNQRFQSQALFSGTGLKLATATGANWTAGNVSDRYAIAIAAVRAANHGNQSITLDLNETDDFADGPWSGATAISAGITAGGTVARNAGISKSSAVAAGGTAVAAKVATFFVGAAMSAGGAVTSSLVKVVQIASALSAGASVAVSKVTGKLATLTAGGTVAVTRQISKLSALSAGGTVAAAASQAVQVAAAVTAGASVAVAKLIGKASTVAAGASVASAKAATFRRSATVAAGGAVAASIKSVVQVISNLAGGATAVASNIFIGGPGGAAKVVKLIRGVVRSMVRGIARTVFHKDDDR